MICPNQSNRGPLEEKKRKKKKVALCHRRGGGPVRAGGKTSEHSKVKFAATTLANQLIVNLRLPKLGTAVSMLVFLYLMIFFKKILILSLTLSLMGRGADLLNPVFLKISPY